MNSNLQSIRILIDSIHMKLVFLANIELHDLKNSTPQGKEKFLKPNQEQV